MKKSKTEELNELFEEWIENQKDKRKKLHKFFAKDGIICEEEYGKSGTRILFILKEPNIMKDLIDENYDDDQRIFYNDFFNNKFYDEINIKDGNRELKAIKNNQEYIKRLALVDNIKLVLPGTKIEKNCINIVFNDFEIHIPLSSIVNQEEELARLNKEIEKTKFEIARSEKLLANQGFVAKAPANLIAEEKTKLEKNKQLLANLMQKIK